MKRILVAALIWLGLALPSFAACPLPLFVKDASGTTQAFASVNDTNGNCNSTTVIVDATTPTTRLTITNTTPTAAMPGAVVLLSPVGQNGNGQALSQNSAPVVGASDWVQVVGKTATVAFTPTVTTGVYSPGQLVGGLMTFAGVGRVPNNSGVLADLTLAIVSTGTNQAGEYDIVYFDSNPTSTTFTDHAIPSIAQADVNKQRCVIKMTANLSPFTSGTIYKPQASSFAACPYSGTTGYMAMVTASTPTAVLPFTTAVTVTGAFLED